MDIIRASIHLLGGDELHGQRLQTFEHAGHSLHIATATVGGMHELAVFFRDPEQMRALARWAAAAADEAERSDAAARRPALSAAGDGR